MSEQNREAVSALLDGELVESLVDATLDHLVTDQSLRDTLGRYQLIGGALRGETAGGAQVLAVAAAVRDRVAAEPTILAPRPMRPAVRWRRAGAGLAIAASVAAIAIGVLPRVLEAPATGPLQVAEAPRALPAAAVPVAVPVKAKTVVAAAPRAQTPLAQYLADHNEFATRGAASGFMPYTTLVTYDGR